MNTTINHQRLDVLAAEIARLDAELLDVERASHELLGSEEDCEVSAARLMATRIELDRLLRAYFIEGEVVRRGEQRAA